MLRIEVYTEITCPWCVLGHHRLDKVLAEQFPGLPVEIVQYPVLLQPDAPAEGRVIADLLRSRYGITDPKQAFARPEAEARASGLALDLSAQPKSYPTQAAHALILAARERGTEHELAVAITRAYFMDAKNIADPAILADVAVDHGFERDEAIAIATSAEWRARVEAEAAGSFARGVRSVPHFKFGAGTELSGASSEADIAAAVRHACQGETRSQPSLSGQV